MSVALVLFALLVLGSCLFEEGLAVAHDCLLVLLADFGRVCDTPFLVVALDKLLGRLVVVMLAI